MADSINVFEAISRRMGWLGKRQEVLAQNVANADTPDYRPHDMKEGPFARTLRGLSEAGAPRRTNPAHLSGIARPAGGKAGEERYTYETAPSGNAVVIEEQLAQIGRTQADYGLMSNLYRKHMRLFKTALGGNGQ